MEEAHQAANDKIKKAEYELLLSKEQGEKIILKAREKVDKHISEAKQEYNEIRGLIEESLGRYRSITDQNDTGLVSSSAHSDMNAEENVELYNYEYEDELESETE
jgi:hypothetical protein